MIIQEHFDFPMIQESLEDEFLEMAEYSVKLYQDGIIIKDDKDNLIIPDYSGVDMVKLDLDAVRWWNGTITTEEYINSIDDFYRKR